MHMRVRVRVRVRVRACVRVRVRLHEIYMAMFARFSAHCPECSPRDIRHRML